MFPNRGLAGALLFAALWTAGCTNASRPADHATTQEVAPRSAEQANGLAGTAPERDQARKDEAKAPTSESKPNAAAPAAGERYIIRRASVTLEVTHVREAMARINSFVRTTGGFVSDSALEATEGQPPSARLTVRVPADHFDGLLDSLGGLGNVRARQVTGEDVTSAFIDTQSQVRNLKREEAQLLKLLDRSGKLPDILEVERELTRVRGEIERAEGQLRHMAHMVELATIEIALTEPVQVSNASPRQLPAVVTNAWQNAQRDLAGVLASLIAGAIWLVGFVLPLVVPAALLYWLVGRALRLALVERRHLVSLGRFRLAWAVVGLAALCMIFPTLAGLAVLAGAIAALSWAASAVWKRFVRPTAPPPAQS